LVRALKDRGLSADLAKRYVEQAADLALIQEILGYYDAELAAGRLKKRLGSLRGMLEDPVKWNFEHTPDGWRRPPPATDGRQAETKEGFDERVRRDRAAREQQYARVDGGNGCKT
jgi:hypothetical protein